MGNLGKWVKPDISDRSLERRHNVVLPIVYDVYALVQNNWVVHLSSDLIKQ